MILFFLSFLVDSKRDGIAHICYSKYTTRVANQIKSARSNCVVNCFQSTFKLQGRRLLWSLLSMKKKRFMVIVINGGIIVNFR